MAQYYGTQVSEGIVIGTVFYESVFGRISISDSQAIMHLPASSQEEQKRLQEAMEYTNDYLSDCIQDAIASVGNSNAQIFEAHRLLLNDPALILSLSHSITDDHLSAEASLYRFYDTIRKDYSKLSDSLWKDRLSDIEDVLNTILRHLLGYKEEAIPSIPPGSIYMSEDLTPSRLLGLPHPQIVGIVLQKGSANSHAAILAKTMHIPLIVGVPIDPAWHQQKAVLDALSGTLTINPDQTTLHMIQRIMKDYNERILSLRSLIGKKTIHPNGKQLRLFANIGSLEDLPDVLANDAEGVGLFRTEFLFMQKRQLPTEEEQYLLYQQLAQKMHPLPVVIRTLDFGSDKLPPYLHLPEEANPALGIRGMRLLLTHPQILQTQLRAILRANETNNLSILLPMIISLEEIKHTKMLIKDIYDSLTAQGLPVSMPRIGVMIETPASVLISDILAKEVDFFSVGTNDLTQYTLAIDRDNQNLIDYADPKHPSLLRLLDILFKYAHESNTEVTICGQLAADPQMTSYFVNHDVYALSLTPGDILQLRQHVCNLSE